MPRQINLSWTAATDNVGVTGYRVERCQGAGCTNFAQIATPAGTTFGDTGLTAATNYSYRVKAVDAATNVSVNYSNVANATTQAAARHETADRSTGLTATAVSTTQINLGWTASTDNGGAFAGYRVERCQGAGCTSFAQIATPATNSYQQSGPHGRHQLQLSGAGSRWRRQSESELLEHRLGHAPGRDQSGDGLWDERRELAPPWPMPRAAGTPARWSTGPPGSPARPPMAKPCPSMASTMPLRRQSGDLQLRHGRFTIELWAKRNVLGGAQRHLFSKCHSTLWQSGCKEFYFNPSNQLTFGSFATGDTVSSTIADTNWHHVAVTFTDSTNTLQDLCRGALVTTATKALEADNAAHVVTVGNLKGQKPSAGCSMKSGSTAAC